MADLSQSTARDHSRLFEGADITCVAAHNPTRTIVSFTMPASHRDRELAMTLILKSDDKRDVCRISKRIHCRARPLRSCHPLSQLS
jgi:hypothetical protein